MYNNYNSINSKKLPNNLLLDLNECGIKFPLILPIYDNAPNYAHLQEWVDSQHTPTLRKIANLIVENINYISFEKFLVSLQRIVSDFNNKINNEPYVLVVAESSKDAIGEGCSDQWVTGLALERAGLNHPVKIITVDKLVKFLLDNSNIKHALILDDASYSATQKTRVISEICSECVKNIDQIQPWTLHLAIPYMTSFAFNLMRSFNNPPDKKHFQLDILQPEILLSVKDLLIDYIPFLNKLSVPSVSKKHTLTYFAHKYPDLMSTFPNVYTGALLTDDIYSVEFLLGFMKGYYRTLHVDFDLKLKDNLIKALRQDNKNFEGYNIPITLEPYRLHSDQYKQQLVAAIENGTIGTRNQYKIDCPELEELISNTMFKKAKFNYKYKESPIPTCVQELIDKEIFVAIYIKTQEEKQRIKWRHRKINQDIINRNKTKLEETNSEETNSDEANSDEANSEERTNKRNPPCNGCNIL